MFWIPWFRTLPKEDTPAERVERVRLRHFITILHAKGYATSVKWKDTQYVLTIWKGRRPLRLFGERVQTLKRETVSTKPLVRDEWQYWSDYKTYCLLVRLYGEALQNALRETGVSLKVSFLIKNAICQFPPELVYPLHAFPVRCMSGVGELPKFEVVSARPFTKKDHELVQSIRPGMEVVQVDCKQYPSIYEYLGLFLEVHLGNARSHWGMVEDAPEVFA